ncbi:MAG TPA: cyclic nucleotide-binding domain-containing protein [Thermoanaerobaculia bacterium]|nr:cyclic nucleotide-binding domain-containing protein [Thermoanaerobaculia bacterium]
MITVEKVLFLGHVPVFAGMPSRELGRIAAITEEVVSPAGTLIFRQDDAGDSMFLVVEGEVAILRDENEIARIGPSGYFGEMAILDDEPRSASAVATGDSLLLRIKRQDFVDIVTSHPHAALAIIRTLSKRLRSMLEKGTGVPQRSNV